MLVVGCTKTRFTLLYKHKIDLPVFSLTPKCPPKIAGNCLTEKLFNYLFFGVWFEKNTIFSTKSSENGPNNGSNFAKIISRKNYLIICFLAVSRSNWLKGRKGKKGTTRLQSHTHTPDPRPQTPDQTPDPGKPGEKEGRE